MKIGKIIFQCNRCYDNDCDEIMMIIINQGGGVSKISIKVLIIYILKHLVFSITMIILWWRMVAINVIDSDISGSIVHIVSSMVKKIVL